MIAGYDVFRLAYTGWTWIIPIVFAITLHEAAHGYAAWRCGDDTAYRRGRVSLNPFRHIDGFGTILLPALVLLGSEGRFVFGYAKPVPVAFHRLNYPRRDMVWVAAAGPLSNLAMAVVAALLWHLTSFLPTGVERWFSLNIKHAIYINLFLAVFNMIPMPPLDGGRVAVGLLPDVLGAPLARLDRSGIFILIGIIFLLPLIGGQLGVDLDVVNWLVPGIIDVLFDATLFITGHH
ncbi:MAG: site-2 protease family protein [Alphaproteobacteria bacterium]|nr:site-2 protease family protein [Alphaproteobacteria bacterium]